MKLFIDITGAVLLAMSASAQAQTIFSDDFNDGNLTGWTVSGLGKAKNVNNQAQLSRTTAMTQTVSASGFSNVQISIDHASQGLESGDSCISELSLDAGNSFTTVGTTTKASQTIVASPSGIDNNSDLVVRVRANNNSTKDYCLFDNIVISGDPETPDPQPEIEVSGNSAFGNVDLGETASSVLTVNNLGDANLVISSVSVLTSPFNVSSDNCSNSQVSAGSGCTITLTFTPTVAQASMATLSIPSNDSSEPTSQVSVTGTGVDPGSSSGPLFSEDFESAADGWSIAGDGDSGVVSKSGSNMLNLAKTAQATIAVSTANKTDVVVSLEMVAASLEEGDTCIAEAQGSGSWVTVGMLENGQDDSSIYNVAASNGSFDNTTLTLRLRASGNINSDDCYFDNISIEPIPGGVPRDEATYAYLMGSTDQTFSTSAFVATKYNTPANTFSGNLVITGTPVFSKNYGVTGDLPTGYSQWPGFDYEFVQDGNRLIPVDRGHSFVGNGAWSISAGVGAVWDEVSDNGYSRAAFPYTIKQNNSNCEHNGLATFLFKDDGSMSNVHVQNVAETCIFYGFEFYGTLSASYNKHSVANATEVIARRDAEEAAWLPTKPLADLAVDFPGVDLSNYGYAIDAADLNGYSILVNGTSYVDGCGTRYGTHPYCMDKTIGIYSFTKSMHAFLVVAALEKQYPGFKSQLIKDLVPECQNDSRWNGVTVEHALDMATGNYTSANYEVDEGSSAIVAGFFDPTTRSQRAAFSCTGWPNKVAPGTYHVYHTTDTELVSYAAAKFANNQLGGSAEAFNDVLVPVYEAIGLSDYIKGIQRTSDTMDAWGGYGLSVTLNDVVRFSQFLRDEAVTSGLLDATMVNEVISGASKGLYAQLSNFNYDNGFWRYHVGAATDMSACGSATQVPVMSGYGGHTSIILPEVIITQLTDGGGIGFISTINDVFANISNACPTP
ncbi:choice-of-anchor D domain-containing protein [Thalassotalea sp. Y01]|uniref:choice-of-anchor D domain-containing protein n=1 Tax=Thalassotalea sp. Y01 TaxID=2729613 RepID=UPI00145D8711|nr:choice-of-anchor D domain-containing protein [Thalassotalea sp. Y01]NMP16953.1 choice-of-anchor D domain-containing protein [Thalassotalea sp. Y01]